MKLSTKVFRRHVHPGKDFVTSVLLVVLKINIIQRIYETGFFFEF